MRQIGYYRVKWCGQWAIMFYDHNGYWNSTGDLYTNDETIFDEIDDKRINVEPEKSIVELEEERLKWSLSTFTEATSISSLRKAEAEIKEVEDNLKKSVRDPEEFADVIMCIFDAAGRSGIMVTEIFKAFEKKLEKNKSRNWAKNEDNSYSHIKK